MEKTIVFIHGNSTSSKIFNNAKEHLIDFNVLTLDLPGHGNNKNNYSEFSLNLFRNFVLEKLNKIQSDIFLVGHSLGGHIAVELSNQIKNLVGLLICGASPLKNPVNLNEAFTQTPYVNIFLKEDPIDTEVNNSIEKLLLNREHKKMLIDDFNMTNPKIRSAVARDILNSEYEDEYVDFLNIKVPNFILLCKSDPIPNPEYLENISQQNKHSEIIPFNSGHYPSVEQPTEFYKVIKDIVEKL